MKILTAVLALFVLLIVASGVYLASDGSTISQTETSIEIPQERYLP